MTRVLSIILIILHVLTLIKLKLSIKYRAKVDGLKLATKALGLIS